MASEHIASDQIYRAKNQHEDKSVGPLTHKLRPKTVALIEYINTRTTQNEKTNQKVNTWSAIENNTNGYPWDGNETATSIETSNIENDNKQI